MSYSLNSLKGVSYKDHIGLVKGDPRSLDYSSYTKEDRYLGPKSRQGIGPKPLKRAPSHAPTDFGDSRRQTLKVR